MEIDELVQSIHGISYQGNGIVATVAVTPANFPGDKAKGFFLSIDVAESFVGGNNEEPRLRYAHRVGLLRPGADGKTTYANAYIVPDAAPVMPNFDIRTAAQTAYGALRALLEGAGVQVTETDESELPSIIGYTAVDEMTL